MHLGSGRQEKFGHIEGLRPSEVIILKELVTWDAFKIKATTYNIAEQAGISEATVNRGLRYLKSRGIVRRSLGKAWFIYPPIKEELIKQGLGRIDSDSNGEQAQPVG